MLMLVQMRDPVAKGKLLDDTARLNDAIQKLLDAVRTSSLSLSLSKKRL